MDNLVLNFVVCSIVVLIGLTLFVLNRLTSWPEFLDRTKHSATVVTFFLWLGSWGTMAVAYFLLKIWGQSSHPVVLYVLDVGDLCLCGAVVTYCGGNRSREEIKDRLTIPFIAALFFILFYVVLLLIGTRQPRPAVALFMFAPSAALATLAIFMFGWAFLVRWGMTAIPFFFLAGAYAVLQIPAYVDVFMLDPGLNYITPPLSFDLRWLIKLLFAFKLFLAAIPFAFFLSTNESIPEMAYQKYWPLRGYRAPLDPKATKALLLMLIACLAIFFGNIIDTVVKLIGLLMSFVRLL